MHSKVIGRLPIFPMPNNYCFEFAILLMFAMDVSQQSFSLSSETKSLII